MNAWLRIPLKLIAAGLLTFVAAAAVITGAFYYVEPSLPSADELRVASRRFQTPLSIYSRDGRLMGQYGEQLRTPARLAEIPQNLKDAIIAAEDDQFYSHGGIDLVSTVRAVLNYGLHFVTRSSDRVPGGSTITQQITRTTNLLERDYDLGRKIAEIFLAFRIEQEFTKDEILELYLNTYFFGQRSYGVAAAARTYFNKELSELTLSEAAIIAGTPTAPSVNNPYNGPENAERRRAYVLRRMEELGYIDAGEREAALGEPIVSQKFDVELELAAGYVIDMVIAECRARLGSEACSTAGITIKTTIDSRAQGAANAALQSALEAYDRKHGYRGAIGRFDLASIGLGADDGGAEPAAEPAAETVLAADLEGVEFDAEPEEILSTLLGDFPDRFGAEAGVVLAVDDANAEVYLRSQGVVSVGIDAVDWARRYVSADRYAGYPEVVGDVLAPGDVVRFRRDAEGSLELAQVPEDGDLNGVIDNYIEGALVSVDPRDGAIVALAGGYDHDHSPFNRAATGKRQPGSSFKPFFYSSALANGFTLSTMINDVYDCYFDATLERQHCVENYSGNYAGLIPLREVFFRSKNASADRVIRRLGARYVANYVRRFGFDPEEREINASLALGSLAVTPLELATAYSVLANGGYAVGIADPDSGAVEPYFIERIEDANGNVLYDSSLSVRMVCPENEEEVEDAGERLIGQQAELFPRLRCAERVESPQIIYLITDVLKSVVRSGSGAAAYRALPRSDLAGKTGTTNGPRDAWFAGFNTDIVTVARVGFDDDQLSLGDGEQGGVTAIPAWIDYMRVMLAGQPEQSLPQPTGIVEQRINPRNGLIAADCNPDTRWEYYLFETQPERESNSTCIVNGPTTSGPGSTGSGSDLFE